MLSLYILTATETVVKKFKWVNAPPAWVFVLLILIPTIIMVSIIYKKESRTANSISKFFLGLIRIAVILALLGVLFEPIIEETVSQIRKPNILFLIDNSLSMNIVDQYRDQKVQRELAYAIGVTTSPNEIPNPEIFQNTNRLDIVNKVLGKTSVISELNKKAELKFFTFSENLNSLPNLEYVEARGHRTNIFDHIIEAIDHLKGRSISGIVLLTDGQHNYGKHGSEEAIAYANRRHTPIYTVGIGSSEKRKDIILSSVDADDVALVEDRVQFDIEIQHRGYEGEDIPIYIKSKDRILEEKFVKLGKEDEKQRVVLSHTFFVPGEQTVTITIPPRDDEFSKDNNTKNHTIKVIQEEIKVLYLDGYPRWEYRYLKNALMRDRTILVNTWLYSADSDFPQDKSTRSPSIRGFPPKEELFKYHCIILGDVLLKDLSEEQQKSLVMFVEKLGGGLAFISGALYDPKDYVTDPNAILEPLLPVVISNEDIQEADSQQDYTQTFHLRLTAEGKVHPIMRLDPDPNTNRILWESSERGLPGFFWFFPVTKAKPGATILATHSTKSNQYGKRIIMATQSYGAGRTFFTALDSSWRWRFLVGDRYFYRFWGQVIKHISIGMLLGTGRRFHLKVDNPEYAIGEIVTITLYAKDANRKPVEDKVWTVFYQTPSGAEKTIELKVDPQHKGTFEGTMIATELGNYKLWVDTPDKKNMTSVIFRVTAQTTEAGNPQLNEELLKKLAEETQGEYLLPYQLDQLKEIDAQPDQIPTEIRPNPLWDNWSILALLVGLFTVEWIGRKLVRLL